MSDVARFLDPNLVQQLNQLQMTARSVVEGLTSGKHRSRMRGASVEFRQHRQYAPGDEPKHLDWRVLARTDRPYVREFQEETNLRAAILLDRSGSMSYANRFGSKFDYAARLTAALAYVMLGESESVGLGVFDQRIDTWIAPHSHRSQLSRLIQTLEDIEPDGPSAPGAAMQDVSRRLSRRSLVIVISDLFESADPLRKGLARLRYDRHEVVLMQVIDPDELEFPFRSFIRFRGLEMDQTSLCNASMLRATYQSRMKSHERELKQACQKLAIEYVRFVTDQPMDEALISFLRKRTKRR